MFEADAPEINSGGNICVRTNHLKTILQTNRIVHTTLSRFPIESIQNHPNVSVNQPATISLSASGRSNGIRSNFDSDEI